MKWLAGLLVVGASALALAAGAFAQDGEPGSRLQPASAVKLRALDKITGNSTDINARVGQSVDHGRLKVTVRACYQSSPQDAPEAAAFLEIYSTAPPKEQKTPNPIADSKMNRGPQPIGPNGLLFSGWMYASSPGLSALEHPTYDVWVISCSTSAPQ
jgi:hypothetical protein